jgi:hypothetical protein
MPIKREDFERGRTQDSLEEKVVRFLVAHPHEAFTSDEIAAAIGHSSHREEQPGGVAELKLLVDKLRFDGELQMLAFRDEIVVRWVASGERGNRYYAAKP